jgi:protoporphyrin/coproporphyrin ferrochelatase
MKGILLVNMGAPASQPEMKQFLRHMFRDRTILPFPAVFRYFLAWLISSLRYKNSWQKYELIGGTPLRKAMSEIKTALNIALGQEYEVKTAYSYSNPFIREGIQYFNDKKIEEIIVLPVYPQFSISTTGSVEKDLFHILKKFKGLYVKTVPEFFRNQYFIEFWKSLIEISITENQLNKPVLIFSAHSIPVYQVEKGDTYTVAIEESARLIANLLDLRYEVSYQSKIGRMKWVEPDTKVLLKQLANRKEQEVLIVPISFVNENLETLYDLDYEIIPYGRNELGMNKLYRVKIPFQHPLLIQTFKDCIHGSESK